jgi:hypothetical protein
VSEDLPPEALPPEALPPLAAVPEPALAEACFSLFATLATPPDAVRFAA